MSFSICHSTLRSDFAPVHSSLVYVFVMMAMEGRDEVDTKLRTTKIVYICLI